MWSDCERPQRPGRDLRARRAPRPIAHRQGAIRGDDDAVVAELLAQAGQADAVEGRGAGLASRGGRLLLRRCGRGAGFDRHLVKPATTLMLLDAMRFDVGDVPT